MYNIMELTSPVEILFAHTYETQKYDMIFCAQENYIEISYIDMGTANVLKEGEQLETNFPGYISVQFRKVSERRWSNEPLHRHTTVGVRVSYTYQRVDDEQLRQWIANNELGKNKYIILPDCIKAKEDTEILGIMDKLIRSRFNLGPGRDAESLGLFMLLLSGLTDRCAGMCMQGEVGGITVYFRRAVNYISGHINEQITVGNVADYVGVSVGYLSRIFKACTGRTIIDYINLAKLNKVKELMRDKGISLKEAGEQTGFENEHYLSKLYKKYMGSSAREDKKYNFRNADFGLM